MQFLTKDSLKGLSTAGKRRVNPFAALERRRLEYAGRARMETGMDQWFGLHLPGLRVVPPEVAPTPEERLEPQTLVVESAGEPVDVRFPGMQEPTPLPSLPTEAVTEMYSPPAEGNAWEVSEIPSDEVTSPVVSAGLQPGVPAEDTSVHTAGMMKGFGEELKAAIKAHPKESIAIAFFGLVVGIMIFSVVRGGID